jgi:hypothetical protein
MCSASPTRPRLPTLLASRIARAPQSGERTTGSRLARRLCASCIHTGTGLVGARECALPDLQTGHPARHRDDGEVRSGAQLSSAGAPTLRPAHTVNFRTARRGSHHGSHPSPSTQHNTQHSMLHRAQTARGQVSYSRPRSCARADSESECIFRLQCAYAVLVQYRTVIEI